MGEIITDISFDSLTEPQRAQKLSSWGDFSAERKKGWKCYFWIFPVHKLERLKLMRAVTDELRGQGGLKADGRNLVGLCLVQCSWAAALPLLSANANATGTPSLPFCRRCHRSRDGSEL